MTTSSRKSYNHEALRGGNADDMDVVKEYGLDPALAYTPQINAAAIEAQYQRNIEAGTKPADAAALRSRSTAMIKKLMK